MTRIQVLRPDVEELEAASIPRAPRSPLPERPVIGLIANGKPLAVELLTALVDELAGRTGRRFEVELLKKPSAGHSITQGEAQRMAARCHMLVSGLGD